jgi:hypothetical protein
MSSLFRKIISEPGEEAILRALAGRELRVREERLDLVQAIRWLHGHGLGKDEITSVLGALSSLLLLCYRGAGWQLLPDINDGNYFLLGVIEEA